MLVNKIKDKAVVAAKSGMSEKTARKYLAMGKLPSENKKPRIWRTRGCPFEGYWGEITAYLVTNPGLEAKTIFNELQRRYPGTWSNGQLRTLQRRVKIYKATEGPAKEVFFTQVHRPGELGEFDFTHMEEIGVTIQKIVFNHLIGHFVLTYSNWEWGEICYSESFESLSECTQSSLWGLGGVPESIRTDRMTSAVHKECNANEFTERYAQLLKHYGMRGEKTQAAKANENGDVEQRHNRFKKALSQALMLRGNSDFDSIEEYRLFLRKLFTQLNLGRKARFKEETDVLKPLPQQKLDTCKIVELKVGPSSTVHILHNVYSVNSRLIGEKIKARVYHDRIEIWYAQRKVENFPRIRGENKHKINYRHIIEWLVRKPGAFNDYRYREDLYPTSRFRAAYDVLFRRMGDNAGKEYTKILHLAFLEGEEKVNKALGKLSDAGENITRAAVELLVDRMDSIKTPPEVIVKVVDLCEYDALLEPTSGAVTANA